MCKYEEMTDIIGASCSLVEAYKGYTEGNVVGDFGDKLVVRLNSGFEIATYRDEVIVYE